MATPHKLNATIPGAHLELELYVEAVCDFPEDCGVDTTK